MLPLTYPNAERVVVDIIDAGTTTHVRNTIPDPRPAAFIVVRQVGGGPASPVSERSLIQLEAWAAGSSAAHTLLQQARALVVAAAHTVTNSVTVYAVRDVGGPANAPDPTSEQARWVCTLSIELRATAA